MATHRSIDLADIIGGGRIPCQTNEELLGIGERLKEGATKKERDGLDRELSKVRGWMEKTRASFDARFWNEEQGLYFSFDLAKKEVIPMNTVATFMPLFAGLASKEQAKRLVEEHLLNPDEYWVEWPLPSTAANVKGSASYDGEQVAVGYDPKNYWRGPAWVNTNWFVIKGLERYGYQDVADQLREKTIEMVRRSGNAEYFDSRTGEPCGGGQFGWTAALVLDLVHGETLIGAPESPPSTPASSAS